MWWAQAALWGIAAGAWMPRGPLTGAEALWSVALSAAVGGLAGWASRSRWSMLVAPAVFLVALELLRLRVDGPSADAPHASVFGFIVLVAGRGVQALLTALPMALGAAYGAGLARRGTPGGRISRYVRRALTAVVAAAVVAATVAVAVPARTAPIPGAHSVAELTHVEVGGHRLGLMIRGADVSAPVLLFVPGAPGGSEFGGVRRHLAALERRFVVVTLDRRGGGSSYPALDPTATVTPGGEVDDIIGVSEHLRRRFGQEKIYLLGHSGGSILGVLAAVRRPELYRAYIGTGQGVDVRASDGIGYADVLAWAGVTGRDDLARSAHRARAAAVPRRVLVRAAHALSEPGVRLRPQRPGRGRRLREPGRRGVHAAGEGAHHQRPGGHLECALPPGCRMSTFGGTRRGCGCRSTSCRAATRCAASRCCSSSGTPCSRPPAKSLTVVADASHRVMFERPDRFAAVMDDVLTQTSR
nr:hypothetical protein GCM10020092_054350 [Actinoplanes digitatis]